MDFDNDTDLGLVMLHTNRNPLFVYLNWQHSKSLRIYQCTNFTFFPLDVLL